MKHPMGVAVLNMDKMTGFGNFSDQKEVLFPLNPEILCKFKSCSWGWRLNFIAIHERHFYPDVTELILDTAKAK